MIAQLWETELCIITSSPWEIKKKKKQSQQSSCRKSKANIKPPTHHKQCLQKRTKPQSILMVPKWIGQWIMGYIHAFKTGSWSELILDGELAEIVEPWKVNTLIQWAGSFSLKNLKVRQKDKTNLTLTFIWNEFETYCKSHSNELRARYKLFKQLSQGTTPCDDWYTTVQNQLTMCNYKAETASVLQCDIFLFGLNDQTFISKIISEESPDVTATTIRQKLKKLEAGRATAKYIKGTNTIGKDPTVEGVNQV